MPGTLCTRAAYRPCTQVPSCRLGWYPAGYMPSRRVSARGRSQQHGIVPSLSRSEARASIGTAVLWDLSEVAGFALTVPVKSYKKTSDRRLDGPRSRRRVHKLPERRLPASHPISSRSPHPAIGKLAGSRLGKLNSFWRTRSAKSPLPRLGQKIRAQGAMRPDLLRSAGSYSLPTSAGVYPGLYTAGSLAGWYCAVTLHGPAAGLAPQAVPPACGP